MRGVEILADFRKLLKGLLLFKEPKKSESFTLKEKRYEGMEEKPQEENEKKDEKGKKNDELNKDNLLSNDVPNKKEKKTREEKTEISRKLSDNMEYLKKVYNTDINSDIVIREFDIIIRDKPVGAFLIFIDGMTDRKIISEFILQPLMLLSNMDIKSRETDVEEYIKKHLLPQNQFKTETKYREIIDGVNFGACALFVDGLDKVFLADVRSWEHRGVERPNTEMVIRGPQEGFNELMRVNTALVRKIIKDENLIVEIVKLGKRSRTPCSILYIKDIANVTLVEEVRRRLKGIKIDYILDSGELEQLLEDGKFLPAPQTLATERPDRVAAALTEGKVAIIMHGSPFALVAPATLPLLVHSSEDAYIRFPYANMLRLIRQIGIILALLLPGMYLAITNYHHEMIPTDLLLAIESSRERVPFPSIIEILIMEVSFELIREAGIRIPGPIGSTLGIIGALILGQAAVAANIVSPILIIIVALTGIGSFSVPNFSLALSFRLLRFLYIFLGLTAGFLGITLGLFLQGMWYVSAKSYGVPFMSPFGPVTSGIFTDTLTRAPIWKQEKRPDYLNVKKERKQPHISREWDRKKPYEGEDDEE